MKKLIAMMLMLLPMLVWAQDDISKLIKLENKRGTYLLGATVNYDKKLCPTDTTYVLAACDEYDYYAPSFPALSGDKISIVAQLDKLIGICENPDLEGMSVGEGDRSFQKDKGRIIIKYYDGRSHKFSLKDLKKFKNKIESFSNGK